MTKPTKPRKPGFYAARDEWARAYVLRALIEAKGNQSHASKLLGISRRTILNQCEILNLPQPGMGRGISASQHREYMARLQDELAKETAPKRDFFSDYAELFRPKPATSDYAQGVKDGRAAALQEAEALGRDGLGDAIAARARCLAAKTIELNASIRNQAAEIAKLKLELTNSDVKARQAVNDMEHAAAAQAQRARDAEAQVREVMAANAELRLQQGRARAGFDPAAPGGDRTGTIEVGPAPVPGSMADPHWLASAVEAHLRSQRIPVTDLGETGELASKLEVTKYASAAEFLAQHPPSNRCGAPPEDHTSGSTCCDGAPLFLRPVSGLSAEEVQAMHDERIKEAFAKLGPPEQP